MNKKSHQRARNHIALNRMKTPLKATAQQLTRTVYHRPCPELTPQSSTPIPQKPNPKTKKGLKHNSAKPIKLGFFD